LGEPDMYAEIKGSVIYGPNLDSELEGSHARTLEGSGRRAQYSYTRFFVSASLCLLVHGSCGVRTLQPDESRLLRRGWHAVGHQLEYIDRSDFEVSELAFRASEGFYLFILLASFH